jgi:hypothetical protein
MNQTLLEYLKDIFKFFNRREVPATKLISLMGRVRPTPIPGGASVTPFDKKLHNIIVRGDIRNPNVVKMVTFSHPDTPLELASMAEEFGPYTAVWLEKENATILRNTNFPEEDALARLEHKIDGFRLEDADGGFNIVNADESKTFVPISEFLVPSTFVFFKEFERPIDPTPSKRQNPFGGVMNMK